MRILLAASAGLYDKNFPETRKSNTGFGHMMRAYANMLPMQGDEVDIITQSNLTNGRVLGMSKLYRHRIVDILFHVRPFYVNKFIKFISVSGVNRKDIIHSMLYFMNGSYIESVIRKNHYDVVHINGIGNATVPILYACSRTNTPFLLTLHGLISFDKSIHVNNYSKTLERSVFKELEANNRFICSVISTGIKRRILRFLETEDLGNLNVIRNPLIEDLSELHENERPKKDHRFTVLSIGNISENKNQKMIVDAISNLSKNECENLRFIFIGGSETNLKKYSEALGLTCVEFTGSLERIEVEGYLMIADLCLMASYNEGFGLPIIEGYAKGVPAIIPTAVDAFEELYDKDCCIPVEEYTAQAFANAIIKAIDKDWDHKNIMMKAQQFNFNEIALEYLDLLHDCAKSKCSPLTTENFDKLTGL